MSAERQHAHDVSVVIASVESVHTIGRCIDSIRRALSGVNAEVIVVDASHDGTAKVASESLGRGRVVQCAPGTLTPELWATGIAQTTGRIVALTTGHFVVEPTWISSLSSALTGRTVGAAGHVDLADDATVTDWAVFYLRYSEFLNEPGQTLGEASGRAVRGIPADNAAYDGDAVRRFVRTSGEGFWEVEFHRQAHAEGRALALVRGATAWFGRSFPFSTILAHRFHHGRHAGAWRAQHGERSALVILLAAPVVPLLLALRVWQRLRLSAPHRRRFLRSLPQFMTLAASWAAGEALGALRGGPAARRPTPVLA
jgi:glycosyltransferase involved in cell wall biosynthesis